MTQQLPRPADTQRGMDASSLVAGGGRPVAGAVGPGAQAAAQQAVQVFLMYSGIYFPTRKWPYIRCDAGMTSTS